MGDTRAKEREAEAKEISGATITKTLSKLQFQPRLLHVPPMAVGKQREETISYYENPRWG